MRYQPSASKTSARSRPQMPRMTLRPRTQISPTSSGPTGRPSSGSTMRTSTPSKGRPQLPALAGREVEVEAVAGVRCRTSRSSRRGWPRAGRRAAVRRGAPPARLPGRRLDRSAVANPGSAARAAAWSGHPRNNVTRSRSSSWRVAPGSGTASVTRVAPATRVDEQPDGEPAGPEERHRDVEAVVGPEAPGVEARRHRVEGAVVGVDRALRRAPAARREQHDEVVVGRDTALQRRRPRPVAGPGREGVVGPDPPQRGSSEWRRPESVSGDHAGRSGVEVVEVAAAPERPGHDQVLTSATRSCAAARGAAAACSGGRARHRLASPPPPAPPSRGRWERGGRTASPCRRPPPPGGRRAPRLSSSSRRWLSDRSWVTTTALSPWCAALARSTAGSVIGAAGMTSDRSRSDDLARPQVGDLVGVVADLAQDLVGVLARAAAPGGGSSPASPTSGTASR